MTNFPKYTLFIIIITLSFLAIGCKKETIQDRAEKEAYEFTRRYCPTPTINNWSTDSIVYNRNKNVYTYYCKFYGILDDQAIIDENSDKIKDILYKAITESTTMKPYLESGMHFRYVCRSSSRKDVVLFEVLF